MSSDKKVFEVLAFMAANTQNRPLTHQEILETRERWTDLTPAQRQLRWERCRRRFEAAQPGLAVQLSL